MKFSSLKVIKQAATALVLSVGLVQAASAGIIITKLAFIPPTAPTPPADSRAVAFNINNPGTVLGPATTVTGTVGPARDRYLVDFTSNELLQASQLRAVDGGINRLGIIVRDGAFTSLYLNFRKANERTNPSRFAEITVNAFGGESMTYDFELLNGNNFLQVSATDSTLLKDLLFVTPFNNVIDVRAVRLGGVQDAPVPEPATLLSFGAGMMGMIAVRRRARRASAVADRS